jgi:hypothetical protein
MSQDPVEVRLPDLNLIARPGRPPSPVNAVLAYLSAATGALVTVERVALRPHVIGLLVQREKAYRRVLGLAPEPPPPFRVSTFIPRAVALVFPAGQS